MKSELLLTWNISCIFQYVENQTYNLNCYCLQVLNVSDNFIATTMDLRALSLNRVSLIILVIQYDINQHVQNLLHLNLENNPVLSNLHVKSIVMNLLPSSLQHILPCNLFPIKLHSMKKKEENKMDGVRPLVPEISEWSFQTCLEIKLYGVDVESEVHFF